MSVRRLRLIDTEKLNQEEAAMAETPAPAAPEEPEEKPLRIAIATNDLEHLNAHFGSAKKFAIYDVTMEEAVFIEAVGFDTVTEQSGKHVDTDDKITPKVDALSGSALLFVLAIGGPAAAKVVRSGIHPVKLKDPESIPAVIERVQEMLKGSPPPWLRRILGRPTGRPDFMDDDDLEEEFA